MKIFRGPATKWRLGGTLAILGVALLIATLVVPWYTWTVTSYSQGLSPTAIDSFYLINRVSSSYGGSVESTGYPAAQLDNTGALYSAVTYLVLAATALGVAGAALLMARRGRTGRTLLVLVLILAILGPLLLLAAQPAALAKDRPSGTASADGPGSSFFGSCHQSHCGSGSGGEGNASSAVSYSGSWGPAPGWYLSVIASVLFLLSVVFTRRRPDDAPPKRSREVEATTS